MPAVQVRYRAGIINGCTNVQEISLLEIGDLLLICCVGIFTKMAVKNLVHNTDKIINAERRVQKIPELGKKNKDNVTLRS